MIYEAAAISLINLPEHLSHRLHWRLSSTRLGYTYESLVLEKALLRQAGTRTREAYSHEVISFGFWPRDANLR